MGKILLRAWRTITSGEQFEVSSMDLNVEHLSEGDKIVVSMGTLEAEFKVIAAKPVPCLPGVQMLTIARLHPIARAAAAVAGFARGYKAAA